jgi:membrane-bound inhibitor of C-type lysozyme
VSNIRLILAPAVFVSLLPLTACVDPADRADVVQSPLIRPPMMATRPATFECDDSGRVVVRPVGEDGKNIVLAFANREVQLKTVPADEGQKYSDGGTVFYVQGTKATLLVGGQEEPESCQKS